MMMSLSLYSTGELEDGKEWDSDEDIRETSDYDEERNWRKLQS